MQYTRKRVYVRALSLGLRIWTRIYFLDHFSLKSFENYREFIYKNNVTYPHVQTTQKHMHAGVLNFDWIMFMRPLLSSSDEMVWTLWYRYSVYIETLHLVVVLESLLLRMYLWLILIR